MELIGKTFRYYGITGLSDWEHTITDIGIMWEYDTEHDRYVARVMFKGNHQWYNYNNIDIFQK